MDIGTIWIKLLLRYYFGRSTFTSMLGGRPSIPLDYFKSVASLTTEMNKYTTTLDTGDFFCYQ